MRNDYRKYYNDDLIELVYETWGRELKLFGFDFNNRIFNNAILKRDIDSQTKQKISYSYKDDILLQDGIVIE